MIKRLNMRKHMPNLLQNIEKHKAEFGLFNVDDLSEGVLELYGSYYNGELQGYVFLDSYQNVGYRMGVIKTTQSSKFYNDLVSLIDYFSAFLDYAYFSALEGGYGNRLVAVIQHRRPLLRIRAIGSEITADGAMITHYKCGFYQ